jgi:hypothetical protein
MEHWCFLGKEEPCFGPVFYRSQYLHLLADLGSRVRFSVRDSDSQFRQKGEDINRSSREVRVATLEGATKFFCCQRGLVEEAVALLSGMAVTNASVCHWLFMLCLLYLLYLATFLLIKFSFVRLTFFITSRSFRAPRKSLSNQYRRKIMLATILQKIMHVNLDRSLVCANRSISRLRLKLLNNCTYTEVKYPTVVCSDRSP